MKLEKKKMTKLPNEMGNRCKSKSTGSWVIVFYNEQNTKLRYEVRLVEGLFWQRNED